MSRPKDVLNDSFVFYQDLLEYVGGVFSELLWYTRSETGGGTWSKIEGVLMSACAGIIGPGWITLLSDWDWGETKYRSESDTKKDYGGYRHG